MGTVERTEIVVRTAVTGDLPGLRRVYRAASLSNAGDRAPLLARPEFLDFGGDAVAAGATRLAEPASGDRIVLGFATVTVRDGAEPELDDLFVDPAWRRRGVARRLVEDAATGLRASGHRRLWVTGNPHARGFYAAAGFVGSEEVRTELGPGLRLHLDLGRDTHGA